MKAELILNLPSWFPVFGALIVLSIGHYFFTSYKRSLRTAGASPDGQAFWSSYLDNRILASSIVFGISAYFAIACFGLLLTGQLLLNLAASGNAIMPDLIPFLGQVPLVLYLYFLFVKYGIIAFDNYLEGRKFQGAAKFDFYLILPLEIVLLFAMALLLPMIVPID